MAQTVLIAKWRGWWGGWTYGPRLLTEIQPALLLSSIPLMLGAEGRGMAGLFRNRAIAIAFTVLLVYSVFVQSIGTFVHPRAHWNSIPQSIDYSTERLWDWRDNPVSRNFLSVLPFRAIDDFSARYEAEASPLPYRPGGVMQLPVKLTNTSKETWRLYSLLYLTYKIIDAKGEKVSTDEGTYPLNKVVPPGGSTVLAMEIKSPWKPGRYTVELHLFQRGVDWFHHKGVPPGKVPLVVK